MGARKEIMVASTSKPYAAPSRPAFGGRDSGPSYGQVLHDIRNAGMISTTTTMEVSPTAANEYLCVIRAEVIMPSLREGDPVRTYSGMGVAYPRKNGTNVIHGVSNPAFYMHIAESRAKKRAWMDALGRGDGLEENIRDEVFAERSAGQREAVPALTAKVAEIWVMPDDAARRIASLTSYSFEEAKAFSREMASQVVRQIKEASQNTET